MPPTGFTQHGNLNLSQDRVDWWLYVARGPPRWWRAWRRTGYRKCLHAPAGALRRTPMRAAEVQILMWFVIGPRLKPRT